MQIHGSGALSSAGGVKNVGLPLAGELAARTADAIRNIALPQATAAEIKNEPKNLPH